MTNDNQQQGTESEQAEQDQASGHQQPVHHHPQQQRFAERVEPESGNRAERVRLAQSWFWSK